MLQRLPEGHRLTHFVSLDSTNAEAQRQWQAGGRGPLWIWAGAQSAGRGRLGRQWVSEEGNLYATFLFTVDAPATVASQVGFVASLAVRDAAMALTGGGGFALKWPNDVLLNGAKFAGILPEALGGNTTMALGIGMNLAHAPQGTPYPVTALGGHIAPRAALETLAAALARWLEVWDGARGFAAVRAAWLEAAIGRDAPVTATVKGREITGTFSGLAADGALMLRTRDGAAHAIHAGEVRFSELEVLRKATP